MKNQTSRKISSAAAAVSIGLVGLSSQADAQELFGSFSDYTQTSGYELQDGALNGSDKFDMFKYGVRAGVTFDDNIFLTDGNEESDVIFTTDLILSLKNKDTAQNTWVLSYVPSYKFYVDNSQFDDVDHNFNGRFNVIRSKTQVSLGANFGKISGSNRYVAGQIDKTVYGASAFVSRVLSGKTRADLTLGYRSEDYDGTIADRDIFTARLGGFYQWTGKFNVGPYVGYEHASVDGAGDQDAFNYGVGFEYQALAKTSINGNFGGETRSIDGADDLNSLTYNLGFRHNYSAKTSFNGSLYRKVSPSYIQGGGTYTATGAYLGANYAASQRLNFHARVNAEDGEYTNGNRDNNYYSATFGGDYKLPNGLELGADVTFRTRDSDAANDDFDNTLLQFDASYYF